MAPDPRTYKRPGAPPAATQPPQNPLVQQLLQLGGDLFGPPPQRSTAVAPIRATRPGMSGEEFAALMGEGGAVPYYQEGAARPMDLSALNAARDALLESELAARKGLVDDARQQARRAAAIHAFTAFPLAAMQLAGAGIDVPDT